MLEPPLNDVELRVVRGMIDEYRYDQQRRAFRTREWKQWQIALAIVAGATAWLANVVGIVYIILNGGGR